MKNNFGRCCKTLAATGNEENCEIDFFFFEAIFASGFFPSFVEVLRRRRRRRRRHRRRRRRRRRRRCRRCRCCR